MGGDDFEGGAAVAEDVLLGGDGAVVLGGVGAEELEMKRGIGLVLNSKTEVRFFHHNTSTKRQIELYSEV